MRYARLGLWSMIFLSGAAIVASPAVAQEGKKPSGDTGVWWNQVDLSLLIEGDPESLHILPAMLSASGITEITRKAGYAGWQTGTSVRASEGRVLLQITLLPTDRRDAQRDPKVVGRAMAERLTRFLAALRAPRPDDVQRLEAARARLEASERTVSRCREDLCRLKANMLEVSGGVAPEALGSQYRELATQKMMLEVELAGLRARRAAVMNCLAEGEKRLANERKEPDLEQKYLRMSLAVSEKDLERLREVNEKAPGTVPARDIELARAKVEEMKIRLAQQHQAAERGPRDELLGALNRQLTEIQIETATVEAKSEAIKKILQKLEPENINRQANIQNIAQRIEEVNGQLEQAIDQRAAARRELARLEEQHRAVRPPRVTLLDDLIPGETPSAGEKPQIRFSEGDAEEPGQSPEQKPKNPPPQR